MRKIKPKTHIKKEDSEVNECVFCQIAAKQSPAYTVYEDNSFLVILSKFPITPGHTLIIPKQHYKFVWDLPPHLEAEQGVLVGKIARAVKKVFGVNVRLFVSGDEISHAHIWLFPASGQASKSMIDFKNTLGIEDDKMKRITAQITAAIG